METTASLTIEQLTNRVNELEKSLAICLGERTDPPLAVILKIWSLLESGLYLYVESDDEQGYHNASDNADSLIIDFARVFEDFVWAQMEKKESHPGFALSDEEYHPILQRFNSFNHMLRKISALFAEIARERTQQKRNSQSKTN